MTKILLKTILKICASIQYTLIEILMLKINSASKKTGITQIAIGGGVAANSELRKRIIHEGEKKIGRLISQT